MVCSRVCAGTGHPFKVGKNVSVLLETLPVRSLARTDDGGVVFGLQPVPDVMVEHGVDVFFPLFKRF